MRERLGETLRAARKAKGWNQTQLAEACKIDRTVISRIESGAWSFGVDTLFRIAHALDITSIELNKSNKQSKKNI